MTILHAYPAQRDALSTPNADPAHRARLIVERLARISYVIDCHQQGIALQSRRWAELQAELELIKGRG